MPFKSRAQEKWMFANKPDMAKKWVEEHKASGKPMRELPERLGKKFSKTKKLIKSK